MKIELSEKEILLLIEVLEDKLELIPATESAERYDYGILRSKLELILKA